MKRIWDETRKLMKDGDDCKGNTQKKKKKEEKGVYIPIDFE